jgi:cytochrome P450
MLFQIVLFAASVSILALIQYFYNDLKVEKSLEHIPTHRFLDGDDSRRRYLSDLKSLLESGYRRYNQSDEAFKVIIPIGGYSVKYRVILPKGHLEEIKHLSNNVFSWQLASRVIFAQDYTGAPDRGPWSGKALRVGIHQNLADITTQLGKRISDYFEQHLPQEKGNVATINLMQLFIPTITYVTNALLVDQRLSSDPEWLKQTSEFAVNRYGAADDVREWPPLLAGFIAPFIPSVKRLRQQRKYVMQKMKPLYDDLKAQDLLGADEKAKRRKGVYGYEWLWGGAPENVTLEDFSDTMMRTLIASIHTTAKTISVALIDLLTQPRFLKELKQEVEEATAGGDARSINLDMLVKLDCFLKESQRLSPVFLCKPLVPCSKPDWLTMLTVTMNRIVTQDYVFKCSGLKVPKGTMVTAPAAAIATDPDTFRDPNTFDGDRYVRLREDHMESASSLVLGMSTMDSLGFGLGNQACPGRFLAVNNLKLMLAKLLIGWGLQLEENGQEYRGPRPEMEYNDFSVVPASKYSIRLRKL